jgi:hypothetical protein
LSVGRAIWLRRNALSTGWFATSRGTAAHRPSFVAGKESAMPRTEETQPKGDLKDLENERPGFTPTGNPKEDADKGRPSTTDRHQPSALGGEVATTSKVHPDD